MNGISKTSTPDESDIVQYSVSGDAFGVKPTGFYPIHPERRAPLFFVHVPKTAGMALRAYLAEQYAPETICPAEGWADLAGESEDALGRYRLIQGHFSANLVSLLDPGIKTLIVLREPVARTLSALRHIRRDPAFHSLHGRAKSMTLGEMVRDDIMLTAVANNQVGLLSAGRPARALIAEARAALARGERMDPYALDDSPVLERAKRRLEMISMVGVTERMGELLALLSREMLFHPLRHLPVMNEAPQDDETLTPAELRRVEDANALDIELYGFANRLIDRRLDSESFKAMVAAGVYGPPSDEFDIDLAAVMPGSGWYGPETENGATWRWTGPDRRFTLELLLNPGEHEFEMDFIAGLPAQAEMLTVSVGDRVIELQSATGDETSRCTGRVPASAIDFLGVCHIVFDVGQTLRPSDRGMADIRPLGICVSRLRFRRLS